MVSIFILCKDFSTKVCFFFSTFIWFPGILDDRSQTQEPSCSDLFLFPDESGNISQEPSPTYDSFTHHLINEAIGDIPAESDDFCILFAPKVAVAVRSLENYYVYKINHRKAYVRPGQIRLHSFLWLLCGNLISGQSSRKIILVFKDFTHCYCEEWVRVFSNIHDFSLSQQ